MQAETKRLALEQLHKAKVKSNSQLFLIYMQQALNPNFTIDLLSPWKLIFFNKLLCHLSKWRQMSVVDGFALVYWCLVYYSAADTS